MQSKTFFFNMAVFRKNVTRFMPLWVLHAVIWLLLLTIPVATRLSYYLGQASYMPPEILSDNLNHTLGQYVLTIASKGGVVIGFVFGILAAMAVWSYLYTARSAGLFASLPISREGMFTTNYLSGIACLTAGNLLVFILTLAAEAIHGFAQPVYLLQWFAAVFMIELFFYSFATLLAMITGHLLALPLLYAVLNFTAIVVEFIAREIVVVFSYGLSVSYDRLLFGWLSPAHNLIHHTDVNRVRDSADIVTGVMLHGWELIGAYCAAGLVISAVSLLMYRRRRMESAGDVVAVHSLRPVFKYVFSAGCAIVLGALFYSIINDFGYRAASARAVLISLCMAAGGVLGCYIAEMFLKKRLRVLRESRNGMLVMLTAVLLCSAALELDLFGIERRIPDPAEIKAINISVHGSNSYSITAVDSESIAQILALHRSAVEHKPEYETSGSSVTLQLSYYSEYGNLEQGNFPEGGNLLLQRVYTIPYHGAYSTDESSDFRAIERLFNSREAAEQRQYTPVPVNETTITSAEVNWLDPDTGEYLYRTLTSVEAAALYHECIIPDGKDSRLNYAWIIYDDEYYNSVYCDTKILIELTEEITADGEPRRVYHTIYITPTVDALRTIARLRAQFGVEPALSKPPSDIGVYGRTEPMFHN